MVLIAPPTPPKTPSALRLTVEDELRLISAGAFDPEDRFELLDGEIINMPPIEAPHGESTDTLNERLVRAVTPLFQLRCQSAIRLNNHSAPEPDFAILQRREGGYGKALPTADACTPVAVRNASAPNTGQFTGMGMPVICEARST